MTEKWSNAQKKLQFTMPQSLKLYNAHVDGVDLFDYFLSKYRIMIRLKNGGGPYFRGELKPLL